MLRRIAASNSSLARRVPATTLCTPKRSISKVYKNALDALDGLQDGMTVLFGGFGLCGIPENLIKAIEIKGTKNITAVSNDAGVEDFGLGVLLANKQISKIHASYVGEHKQFAKLLNTGVMEVCLTPQGTLAEKLRSGGSGIPAFYTPAGYGTVVQEGGYPVKFTEDGQVVKLSEPKEVRQFNGRNYVLEESITGDFACVKAWKADPLGNLVFRATARNLNPDVAKAGRITIAEVEEIVPVGTLQPDEIHLPGIFVQRVIRGEVYEKRIEKLTVRDPAKQETSTSAASGQINKRDIIAMRAAKEFKNGMYVNLGIGVPTLASNYIPAGVNVILHAENGLLGTGPYPAVGQHDADLINAGKETVSYVPGSSTFSSSDSFAMIRGKHIDLTILGALEADAQGNLASWIVPGKTVKGMGGAMDLVSSCDKIIVTMAHTDNKGQSKILPKCKLPLTGKGVIDIIITELAVFHVDRRGGGGLTLVEHAPGVTVQEITEKTAASFKVSPNIKQMQL